MSTITEEALNRLREKLAGCMSPKRYRHTVAVEAMAEQLGRLYLPDEILPLRAAALLHDITKEYSLEEQLKICEEFGIMVSAYDKCSPKTFHAKTAAALIPSRYPDFAEESVLSAVRWHTTGRAHMTRMEELIYLADYIDESRTFPDCVLLRHLFWSAEPEQMNEQEREAHLRAVLIESFDMTVRALTAEGAIISADTVHARNALLLKHNP